MSVWEIFLVGVGLSMDAFAVSIVKGLAMPRIDRRQLFAIAAAFGGFQALMPMLGWLLGSRFAERIADYDHWIAFVLLVGIGGKMVWDAVGENKEGEGLDGGVIESRKTEGRDGKAAEIEAERWGTKKNTENGDWLKEKPTESKVATNDKGLTDESTEKPFRNVQDAETHSLSAPPLPLLELLLLAIATSIDALAIGVTFSFLSVDILPAATLIGCTTFMISAAGVVIGHLTGTRFRSRAEIAGGFILIFLGVRILLQHLWR